MARRHFNVISRANKCWRQQAYAMVMHGLILFSSKVMYIGAMGFMRWRVIWRNEHLNVSRMRYSEKHPGKTICLILHVYVVPWRAIQSILAESMHYRQ